MAWAGFLSESVKSEIMKKIPFILILTLILVLSGCKQKQNRQQKMISDIEHFNIDTVKAKNVDLHPVTRADSCRSKADIVLRKYPEMYHATDQMQRNYKKWTEEETKYLTFVFVGKDKQHNAEYRKHKRQFETRLEQLNFIEPLCAILTDDDNDKSLSEIDTRLTLDEKAYKDIYHEVMFSVKDGLKSNKTEFSTDEMRTVCEKALMSWQQYIDGLTELLKTMPQEAEPLMEKAILRIKLLHYIDLRNYYITYWSNIKAPFILKDNATDEQISNSKSPALHYCSWMEVKE